MTWQSESEAFSLDILISSTDNSLCLDDSPKTQKKKG